MGKLQISAREIARLAPLLQGKVSLEQGLLKVFREADAFGIRKLDADGTYERQNVSFQYRAQYREGNLDVEFN